MTVTWVRLRRYFKRLTEGGGYLIPLGEIGPIGPSQLAKNNAREHPAEASCVSRRSVTGEH
jgi:hypothetical protein